MNAIRKQIRELEEKLQELKNIEGFAYSKQVLLEGRVNSVDELELSSYDTVSLGYRSNISNIIDNCYIKITREGYEIKTQIWSSTNTKCYGVGVAKCHPDDMAEFDYGIGLHISFVRAKIAYLTKLEKVFVKENTGV